MTNRYKLIDAEGFTNNIILLDDIENYQVPEGLTLEPDDGVYKYKVTNESFLTLQRITALEAQQAPRLLREAALGDTFAISRLKELDSQIKDLRQQL